MENKNEEKIKEIITKWSGKTLSSNEQFNKELEQTLKEYGDYIRQQTLEEVMFKLNKLPMYSIRKEIGVTAPDVMFTSNMPINVVGLCKDDVFSNLQALRDK